MTRDSVFRAVRTFIITFFALWIPALIGFLGEVTDWANGGDGGPAFPHLDTLGKAAVSAACAAIVAIVNLLWNAAEDGLGKGMLRAVPPRAERRAR